MFLYFGIVLYTYSPKRIITLVIWWLCNCLTIIIVKTFTNEKHSNLSARSIISWSSMRTASGSQQALTINACGFILIQPNFGHHSCHRDRVFLLITITSAATIIINVRRGCTVVPQWTKKAPPTPLTHRSRGAASAERPPNLNRARHWPGSQSEWGRVEKGRRRFCCRCSPKAGPDSHAVALAFTENHQFGQGATIVTDVAQQAYHSLN